MLSLVGSWVYFVQHEVLQAPHHCDDLLLFDRLIIHYTVQNVSEVDSQILSDELGHFPALTT